MQLPRPLLLREQLILEGDSRTLFFCEKLAWFNVNYPPVNDILKKRVPPSERFPSDLSRTADTLTGAAPDPGVFRVLRSVPI